jgi:hypothetical protein
VVVGEQFGKMQRARAGAPSLQARLQLAQAAWVDGDDELDLRGLNLIELVVENAL